MLAGRSWPTRPSASGPCSLQYEIQGWFEGTYEGFKQAVEEGAVSGAVFGAFSGANVVSGKLLDKLIPWSWVRIPLKVVANSIAGAASSVTAQALMDAIENTHSCRTSGSPPA